MVCSCDEKDHSLENIRQRKQLNALVRYNSVDYFIYRGYPMGFQFELLNRFATQMGVELNLIPIDTNEASLDLIHEEHIDLIASNISVLESDKERICFSNSFVSEMNLSWGMSCGSDSLCTALNTFIDSLAKTSTQLYHKYYKQPRKGYPKSDQYSDVKGRLSPYDDLIKKHAQRLGWDWRLLASLIYQESNFKPDETSWMGAIGLMQLMPAVAEKYNITLESSADEQILAGVKHLQAIEKQLPNDIPPTERIAFTLAAYNVGVGHILDARRLAIKFGKNPNVWFDNAEFGLMKKSDRKILRDTLVRHGYARGEETSRFVRDIITRWEHYENLIP
ncbi:MAG: transglycosylase SLT domain-containing protein [Bacteroidales bacterium]|jgi:membrane-bound lytic murein transglycosylase F|nr:transglycosylase SLT domain-containing protein [Bacteroidales bacterium]